MRFQTELVPATLIRRYKRFLADCKLSNGLEIVAHCANPGSMMGLAEPGAQIWLEPNDDPKKKLKFRWRLVELDDGHFAGVDTSVPNHAVREALQAGIIQRFARYSDIRPEQKYGQNSRVDFLLKEDGLPDCYLEVKSVTLSRQTNLAEFPDSVTTRGTKHLQELTEVVKSGHSAVMLYLVQRTDCKEFSLASDIDPSYVSAFSTAIDAGVESLCLSTHIDTGGITVGPPVRFAT